MAIELFANAPSPGAASPWSLGTLTQAITTTPPANTQEVHQVSNPAPVALRASGVSAQFRVVIDNEIMIVTATASGLSPWTFTRGAEGTIPAAHVANTQIYHVLTAGALASVAPSSFGNALQAQNNLSDLANVAQARTNLGLGSAALANTTSFDTAGAASAAVAVETSRALIAEAAAEQLTHKNQPGGYPGLDSGGLLATSVIPAIAITDVHVVGDQASMLSIPGAHQGSFAIRTDLSETFVAGAGDVTQLATWIQLANPQSVVSVNGQTGTVSLTAANVGADASGAAAAAQAAAISASLQKSNNLSDLANVTSARTNLGLGSAATQSSAAFDTAGAATSAQAASLQKSNNLSDLNNVVTARANLGLGSSATHPSTDFDTAGAATAAQIAAQNASLPATTTLDAIPGAINNVDLRTHRIVNIGDAVAATDALNRETADSRYDVLGSASAVAASSIPLSSVGIANGVAALDATGLVPTWQLPAGAHVFVQDTIPSPTVGFGEYVWFVMDGAGNLLDIQSGTA